VNVGAIPRHHANAWLKSAAETAMIEKVLNKMGGVGVYGILSICLFFAVFIGVIVWTLCLKKRYVNEMKNLPLEDASEPEPDADAAAKPENHHD
jgi:cbb3-type cytochrome oxidase subunit 3